MIPNFDHNLVLPPHTGNPVNFADLSPYPCTSNELCNKFSTSSERIGILKNFLKFRSSLRSLGLLNAIQWLDGSFLEDIEQQAKRAPRDLDCVTIYWGYDRAFQNGLVSSLPEFADPISCKKRFQLDHYPFDAGYSPLNTVEMSRYWAQLFSHNRLGIWKGMLSISVNTPIEDSSALSHLQSLMP
jgi:hypothetical protein